MVFDTVVLAGALLRVDPFFGEASKALACADEIAAPDLAFAEFTNVAARKVLRGEIAFDAACAALFDLECAVADVVPLKSVVARALDLAVAAGHPAYDAIFVAAAEVRDTRLVTYDRRLVERYPDRAVLVPDYLRRAKRSR